MVLGQEWYTAPMSHEQEPTIELVTTRTAFEADSIAAGLRARDIDARVYDTASASVWGGAPQLSAVKVVVLASQEAAARRAMEEMKAESTSIDWDAVDVGDEAEGVRMTEAAKARRWMWTLVVLLVPVGLAILALGIDRGDGMIKMLGGILVISALVMGAFLMGGERR